MKSLTSFLILSFTFSSFAGKDCKDVFKSTPEMTESEKELTKLYGKDVKGKNKIEEDQIDSFLQKLNKKIHEHLTDSEKKELAVELRDYLRNEGSLVDFLQKVNSKIYESLTDSEKRELVGKLSEYIKHKESLDVFLYKLNTEIYKSANFTDSEKEKLISELREYLGVYYKGDLSSFFAEATGAEAVAAIIFTTALIGMGVYMSVMTLSF